MTARRRRLLVRAALRRAVAPLVLAAGLAVPAAVASPPQRVVSLHLCTDQLLLGLADRAQIASLSRYAGDPERSHLARAAAGLPRNLGTAEEAVALGADLVLAVAPASRATVHALSSLGYRVLDLPLPQDFAAIRAQTRQVAAALGHTDRAETLIAAMDRRLAAATADAPSIRPAAVVWQPGGFTNGPGSLEHEVLTAAGFDNLAARLGIGPLGRVPLERLVLEAPDLIVNWMGHETAPSLARDSYDHPALRRAVRGAPFVAVPPRLWTCGAWFTAEAVEILAAARRKLVRTMGRSGSASFEMRSSDVGRNQAGDAPKQINPSPPRSRGPISGPPGAPIWIPAFAGMTSGDGEVCKYCNDLPGSEEPAGAARLSKDESAVRSGWDRPSGIARVAQDGSPQEGRR